MAWVELVGRRTQKAKHFYDADTDKYRAEFTIHDRHYADDFGDWWDVDESLVDDTGGFNKKCDKTRHIFQIASGGNRRWYPRRNVLTEYVDITGMQYWANNQWRNLNLPAAVWKSQGAEWDMPDLYANITNTWRQIKTDFILKNSNAYTRLRFAISFTGLSYNHATGELTSTTDGLVWGYIQKPTAKDANDAEVIVTQTYSGGYIEWSVNTAGATFPIAIDPTFIDGPSGDTDTACDDGMLSDQPNWNNGVRDSLWIRSNRKILLRFILESISSSAICTSATLSLFSAWWEIASDLTINVYHIADANGDWIEGTKEAATAGTGEPCWNYKAYNTVNWAGSAGLSTSGTDYNASSLGSDILYTTDPTGHELIFDLTADVIESWFGQATNNGILIVGELNIDDPSLCSSDHATTGYRPKLVVDYSEGCTVETVTDTQTHVETITTVAMETL